MLIDLKSIRNKYTKQKKLVYFFKKKLVKSTKIFLFYWGYPTVSIKDRVKNI